VVSRCHSFLSYSFAGLMNNGLGQEGTSYTDGQNFAENGSDLFDKQTLRTLFELAFFTISMFVVSIITGIICDTFGELRAKQDDAVANRSTMNFITGIPFAELRQEKSTNYLQYVFLMLYLRTKDEDKLTPLEVVVHECVKRGDIGWLPDGRCRALEVKNSVRLCIS
jgi:hypothetical protein